MTLSSFSLAVLFLCAPDFVSERPSGASCLIGLYLGGMRLLLVSASLAHRCGFLQPFPLSIVHSWHLHSWVVLCIGNCNGCRILADIFIRSATLAMLCLYLRHLACKLFIGLCSSLWRWYQAGSWFRRCGVILMASMFAWYLFATLIILLMSSFRMDPLGPWRGIFHACRNGLSLTSSTGYLGVDANRIWSVTAAHCWRDAVKLRYTFNHMISIVSFHDSMSRRFNPPSLIRRCRVAIAIFGLVSCPHMNSLMSLFRAFIIVGGIPCAFVRNCMCPPIIAWTNKRLPFKVGCTLSRSLSFALMVFNIGSQGAMSFTLLPIQAPRILTVSPSQAIWISLGSCVASSWFIFLDSTTLTLCLMEPISMISVFSMLKRAPETSHHSFRILCTWSSLSSLFRKRLMSSANNLCPCFGLDRQSASKCRHNYDWLDVQHSTFNIELEWNRMYH